MERDLLKWCSKGLLLFVLLAGCKEVRKENDPQDIPVAKDTLQPAIVENYNLVYYPFLQEGILMDTTVFDRKDSCAHVSIILPKKNSTNAIFYKKLDRLRKEIMQEYHEAEGDGCDDMHYQGFWLAPRHLYQSDKYISYAIRNESGYSGMPSAFIDYTFNYDLRSNKEIKFKDFFIIQTSEDSMRLGEVITHSINEEYMFKDRRYADMLTYPFRFAFDNDNVYFFFERYGLVGWGGQTGAVRKKYISTFINKKFQ